MILREVNKEYVDIISYADLKKKKSFFFHAGKVCRGSFFGRGGRHNISFRYFDNLMCQKNMVNKTSILYMINHMITILAIWAILENL